MVKRKMFNIRCHYDSGMWGLPFALFYDRNNIYKQQQEVGWFLRLTLRFLCFSMVIGFDYEKEAK